MNIVTMEKKLNFILDFIFEVTVLWTECFFPLRKPHILKRRCVFLFTYFLYQKILLQRYLN